MNLTPFESYPKDFKEEITRNVLDALKGLTREQRVAVLREQLKYFTRTDERYWWVREALWHILEKERYLFREAISGNWWISPETVELRLVCDKLKVLLQNPEITIAEVCNE